MKKLVIAILSLGLIQVVFADDTAKLHMNVQGAKGSAAGAYYVCLPDQIGCVSLVASEKRQSFPIDTGKVQSIFAANMNNLKMYTQALPRSCQVEVAKDQTLTVSGKLVTQGDSHSSNNIAYIKDLHCTLT
jgi:hypothetical protein